MRIHPEPLVATLALPAPLLAVVLAVAFVVVLALPAVRAEEELLRAGPEVTNVLFPERIARSLEGRGGWLSAYLEIRTSAKDAETLVLEGAVSTDEKRTHAAVTRAEVAPGAPRRAWVYLWGAPGQVQQTATVEARTAGGPTVRKGDRWMLSSFEQQRSLGVIVVGENLADITPWPSGTKIGTDPSDGEVEESADALPARALPDSVLGYHGADLVVVRDLGGDRLEPRQLEALRSWVYLGGTVVLAPMSRSDAVFRSEMAGLLLGDRRVDPVSADFEPRVIRLAGEATGERLSGALRKIMGRDAEGISLAAGDRPLLTLLDPLGGRAPVEIRGSRADEGSSRQDRLYVQLPLGEGRVGLVTFAGMMSRQTGVDFLRAYWGTVLKALTLERPSSGFVQRAAMRTLPELETRLNDPSRDVGVPFFAALVGGYLVLMGPVLYYVLKRKNRLQAVIWVEPLVVVLYLGVILGVGYFTKGVLTKTRAWTLIQQQEGDSLALRESYLTIFSGSEASYRVECPRGFLLQPIFRNQAQEQPVRMTWGGEGAALAIDGYRLAHWDQGHLVNLEVLDLGGQGIQVETLEAGERSSDPPRAVRLTNRLSLQVAEGVFRSGEGLVPFPRIAPGASLDLRLDPRSVLPSAKGSADEPDPRKVPWRRVLSALADFQGGGFAQRGRMVLAAALDRPEADFRLDRRSSLREKVDIYVLQGPQ